MSNQSLQFKRVASMSGEALTVGAVYFEDNTGLIHICTSTGENGLKTYSGVKDVNWNATTHVLSFTKSAGNTIELDFDNLVGFDDFDKLVEGTGLIKQGTDSSIYRLGANGTGIAGAHYIDASDSSTISGALKTLDAKLYEVDNQSGVISLGGAKGVLSIDGSNTSTGEINLTMDGSTLKASIVNPSSAAYKTVEYFVGVTDSTDASTDDTIKGAKKYTAEVLGPNNDTSNHATVYGTRKWVEETIGNGNDASTVVTVHGAINKAEAVKTELLGDASEDSSASKTIEGLTKKINETSTNATLHLYSGASGETPATNVTADGQTYRLVQGTTTVATFNIEKDSFVQDASVVYFATDADASAGTGDSTATAGHYIHLVVKTSDATSGTAAEKDIWIPAESLVDAYTAVNPDTSNIVLTINQTNNTISASVPKSDGTHLVQHNNTEVTLATIAGQTVKAKVASLENTANNTAGGVKITENVSNGNAELSARIVDGAVTTAKIVDGNVTEAKLSADVSTKLNGAVQTVTGETAISNPSTNYIDVKVSAAKTGTDVSLSTTYSLTTHDVSTATSSSTGVATAYDVQTYVQTYVSEQLVWASWPTQQG